MANRPLAEQVTFRAHPRYLWLAGAGFGVALLFGWEMARGEAAPELIFFFLATLLAGLWYARTAATAVHITAHDLTVAPPLVGRRSVQFRQLAGVSLEGRLFDVIVAIYHPVHANGLLDLDDVRSLQLPAVVDQDALFGLLQEKATP